MMNKNPVGNFCNRVFYCLLFFSLAPGLTAHASQVSPLLTRDQNPLLAIYGLPLPVSARLLPDGKSALQVSTNFSNTINVEQKPGEVLFVDAETHSINFIFDTAINKDWMFRLQLPLIKHSAGFMDEWINDYHKLLNLPEGERPFYPTEQINIYYQRNGITQVNLQQQENGLGDISIQLAYQAMTDPDFNLSYWTSLKLATGDTKKLTGSESTDLAFWLACDKQLQNSLWSYLNLGILLMTDSPLSEDSHNNQALFLTTGIQFQMTDMIQLKAQLDNHTAFYDSNTEFLGPVMQLTFGGSIIFDKRTALDIAIAEDIQTSASPDVNFNFTWRRYF